MIIKRDSVQGVSDAIITSESFCVLQSASVIVIFILYNWENYSHLYS